MFNNKDVIKKDKAIILRDFLSRDMVNYVIEHTKMSQRVARIQGQSKHLEGDGQTDNSLYVKYGDMATDTILHMAEPYLSEIWSTKIYPTFSYVRRYGRGDMLYPHYDRVGCGVTVSIKLTGNPWPIYFLEEKNYQEGSEKIVGNIGDAVMWNGQNYLHYHKQPLQEHDCIHLLLAFTEDPNWVYDKRPFLGCPPNDGYKYKDVHYGHDKNDNDAMGKIYSK